MKRPASILAVLILVTTGCFAAPVEIIPPELRGAVQPQVAVAPNERIHVVFGKDTAIYHTASADGRSFSAPVQVGELDKLALRMRRGPRVTATDKLVLITAISHTDGNLHAWTSADTGKTWKESAPLNTAAKSAREGLQSLAGDGRGLVAAVWLDLRGKGTELWGRVSRDGGATWAGDLSIYQSPDGHICECCVPNVAISPTGEIAAMWRNWLGGSRDLYTATSRDGRTFSPAQKLGTGTWKLNGCPMDGGSIAFTAQKQMLTAWRREGTVFTASGLEAEKLLAPNAAQPLIVTNAGRQALLWEAGGSLWIKADDAKPGILAARGRMASGAAFGKGFIVTWEQADAETVRLMSDIIE